MGIEQPFYMFFLLSVYVMGWLRAYYTGYVNATGETVDRLEEGVLLRRLRYSIGTPFIVGVFAYLLNPNWMSWAEWEWIPSFLRWFGVLSLFAGTFIYGWTHRHLGKNFTDTVFVRQKSTLIQDGPYAWVRHPMYVSAMLFALGAFLVTKNWFLGLTGVVLMLIIMFWRTPIEEQKLIAKHGDAYRDYMKKTGRFFPC